ncbi:MAG TPA: hypothetical protein VL485_30250 [Ktedonobacteraceae bacterium]|jgi:hypothetical protein|nr:hypothetical protein [Ktedonobacteraceae bacterium]
MNWLKRGRKIDDKESISKLYREGFTGLEVRRLCHFYEIYQPDMQDREPLDIEHLRFARWLVEHGKLTEQLS